VTWESESKNNSKIESRPLIFLLRVLNFSVYFQFSFLIPPPAGIEASPTKSLVERLLYSVKHTFANKKVGASSPVSYTAADQRSPVESRRVVRCTIVHWT
jgi:hypothetical protein